MAEKTSGERVIRISRRVDMKKWQKLVIKASFVVFAFLLCALVSTLVAPGTFGTFVEYTIVYHFVSANNIMRLLWETAFLFLIALALTPAFKMKFWNIGGEGQCLMGVLGATIGLIFIAPHVPNFIALVICLVMAIGFAIIWAVIPAIFKAYFNTNETLFTLMMNYIATGIVMACIYAWSPTKRDNIPAVNTETQQGWLPVIGNFGSNAYVMAIMLVVFVGFLVWVYLKYSKHGYELSVVGGSRDTARYVGINVKLTIIRTMVLSGALCGFAGFLLTCGFNHTMTSTAIAGRGFTAIMVSWLGAFSVPIMLIYSFLISFVSIGSERAAMVIMYSSDIVKVVTALFFLVIITSEFFINFRLHINLPFLKKKKVEEIKEETV